MIEIQNLQVEEREQLLQALIEDRIVRNSSKPNEKLSLREVARIVGITHKAIGKNKSYQPYVIRENGEVYINRKDVPVIMEICEINKKKIIKQGK